MSKNLEEKTVKKEQIFKGKVVELEVQDVLLPNGNESKREIIYHPGAVAVIAFTKEEKLILVKQFRKALDKVIAEIPAGKLEKGEDPLECAKRELEEETGIVAHSWTKLHSFYTSPGFANEIVHVYLAKDLNKGTINLDEDEFVEKIEVTKEEAEKLIENEVIHDAKTLYAVQYWQLMKGKVEKDNV
ncbi:NUDIX hydrolase [Salipaludibacillus agaradhaerens]|uniref:NUDIX hydrolase n=1 Tax=Salipaludibacillus agaradhaerens TaxID=76935 RepID=UPI0021518B96|nr:NUDIX hydrolase [Salipaludibacillus agaradhaerens]MCR6106492.1 NUDIX hydrolase [Salipaludibacillus agaradhaerens]MCR6118525.1 NUDIX hydrolase [Salipaludibacillus agaradhaerens]UJW57620.1 NUDIX hydrolase [Bacillus sp. A116_S68]